MQPANRNGAAGLSDLRRLLTDESFAISILAAVAAATILAFGFGATPDIIILMLVVGVVTALAETRLRARKS
ncbi:MAG: hypothetical protein ACRED3_07765 [Bradyrhizobium sp.]